MYKIELHFKDGNIFNVKYDAKILEAGILKYNERFFVFRKSEAKKIIYEESPMIYLGQDDIIK